MIAYEITTFETRNNAVYSKTASISGSTEFGWPGEDTTEGVEQYYISTEARLNDDLLYQSNSSVLSEYYTISKDGASSNYNFGSYQYSGSEEFDGPESIRLATYSRMNSVSRIQDTDGVFTYTSMSSFDYYGSQTPPTGGDEQPTFTDSGEFKATITAESSLVTTEKPITSDSYDTILGLVSTTTESTILVGTTITEQSGTNVITRADIGYTTTQATSQGFSQINIPITIVTFEPETVRRAVGVNPPRKYATVYIPQGNEAAWQVTDLNENPQFTARAFSEFADLKTSEFTQKPVLFSSSVLIRSSTTFPDQETEQRTANYTTLEQKDDETIEYTFWDHPYKLSVGDSENPQAFPLSSYTQTHYKNVTSRVEFEFIPSSELPDSQITEIKKTFGDPEYKNSFTITNQGLQIVSDWQWTTDEIIYKAYSETTSTSYFGLKIKTISEAPLDSDGQKIGEDTTVYWINVTEAFEEKETLSATNYYRIGWNEFNPAKPYFHETSFRGGWALYNTNNIIPNSKIDIPIDFWPAYSSQGELKRDVGAAFPNTTSWITNNKTLFGRMLGNSVTITTQSTLLENNQTVTSSESQNYAFVGEGIALTSQQINSPAIFGDLKDHGLSNFCAAGNNPVTSTNKVVGLAGVYGKINYGIYGGGTVYTEAAQSPFTSAISSPVAFFAADKRWWPATNAGAVVFYTNRNPIPDGYAPL